MFFSFRETMQKVTKSTITEEGGNETSSVTQVSVEVVTVDANLCKKYNRRRQKQKKTLRKKVPMWNLQTLIILLTVVVFIVVVVLWSLLWVFIFRRENSSGVYFAGMLRVANVEFLPEYRFADSTEFLSMATGIQHVVNSVYKSSSVSGLYMHCIISDLSNHNKGGVLVHFWLVFVAPQLKSSAVCEECVSAILRDSVLTSLKNRSSVGYLLGLPVDIDSILINDSKCVEKLHASQPRTPVPVKMFSSGGGMSCYMKLTASEGFIIRLSISDFHMDPSNCVGDSVIIYDALLPMRGKILYRVCDPVSQAIILVATGNIMLLCFRMTSANKSFRGDFVAIVEEPCYSRIESEKVSGFTGQITSPFYPSMLPPTCTCTWKFQTPHKSLGVSLMFHNYVLTLKDLKACEHGWWKVNEIIYCGNYISHGTVFHVTRSDPEVVFLCSSLLSELPFIAEYGTFNISQPCPEGHFRCSTGFCVESWRRCDGLDDCQDESDEIFCPKPSTTCESSSSVHPVFVCNGERDCPGGQDETNCTLEADCSDIRFLCGSGVCILKKNAKCDGVPDCTDHSDESDCACGVSSIGRSRIPVSVLGNVGQTRVVGGSNAQEGEWPWQVSLYFAGHLYCGASVISSQWLLSAAHCFHKDRLSDPRQWMAHLGMLTQGNAKYVSEIQRIVVHEFYNSRTFDYDIAVLRLRLSWPESLSTHIQPVCLPAPSQALPGGLRCWVSGWGYRTEEDKVLPSVLQKAPVLIYSQSDCRRSYSSVSPRMLCAGTASGEQDACRGDSGGPLSCQAHSGGRWFLTGIVSWGAGCGRPNLPGVYTRVAKFITWIKNHTLYSHP